MGLKLSARTIFLRTIYVVLALSLLFVVVKLAIKPEMSLDIGMSALIFGVFFIVGVFTIWSLFKGIEKRTSGKFHVTVEFFEADEWAREGDIKSATSWVPQGLPAANGDNPSHLPAERAAVLQNILPRLYHMQEAVGGLLILENEASRRIFKCQREAVRDTFCILFFMVVIAVPSVFLLYYFLGVITLVWGEHGEDILGQFGKYLIAAFCLTIISGGIFGIFYVMWKKHLAKNLYLMIQHCENAGVSYVEQMEYLGRSIWHKRIDMMHDDHGLKVFLRTADRHEKGDQVGL